MRDPASTQSFTVNQLPLITKYEITSYKQINCGFTTEHNNLVTVQTSSATPHVAYSAELVLLNKHQILGGEACLDLNLMNNGLEKQSLLVAHILPEIIQLLFE